MRVLVAVTALFTIVLLPICSAWSQPEPTIPSLSQSDVERLSRGEVIVDVLEAEAPVGDVLGIIEARPDAVIAVIRALDRHAEVFEDTVLSEVVGWEGEYQIQHGITDTPWPLDDREWTLRVWQGEREVDGMPVWVSTWDYVPESGNLEDTEGYYLVMPWGDGTRTLVRYHIMADLGTWLPDFLLEWSTENMLPNQIEALRRAVAGSET